MNIIYSGFILIILALIKINFNYKLIFQTTLFALAFFLLKVLFNFYNIQHFRFIHIFVVVPEEFASNLKNYMKGKKINYLIFLKLIEKNYYLFKNCTDIKRFSSPVCANETRNPLNIVGKYYASVIEIDVNRTINYIKKLK
jgi:hypothetical protein